MKRWTNNTDEIIRNRVVYLPRLTEFLKENFTALYTQPLITTNRVTFQHFNNLKQKTTVKKWNSDK